MRVQFYSGWLEFKSIELTIICEPPMSVSDYSLNGTQYSSQFFSTTFEISGEISNYYKQSDMVATFRRVKIGNAADTAKRFFVSHLRKTEWQAKKSAEYKVPFAPKNEPW